MSRQAFTRLMAVTGVVLILLLLIGRKQRDSELIKDRLDDDTQVTRLTSMPGVKASATSHARSDRTSSSSKGSTRAGPKSAESGPVVVIRGEVTDDKEFALSGAVIRVKAEDASDTATVTVRASNDGSYAVRIPMPLPPVTLFASHGGYATAGAVIPIPDFESDSRQRNEVVMNFVLKHATQMRGSVSNATGQPIAGALVQVSCRSGEAAAQSIQSWHTTTNDHGVFEIADLPQATVIAQVSKEGFVPSQLTVTLPAPDLDVQLTKEGTGIEGFVFNDTTGKVVPGATIHLDQLAAAVPAGQRRYSTTADKDGAFLFSSLPAGEFTIEAAADGLILKPVDPDRGNRITMAARETTRSISLFLYEGHALAGVVRERLDKTPIEGVVVETLSKPLRRSVTGKDGSYRLEGITALPDGPWVPVRLTKPGYELEDARDAPELVRMPAAEREVTKDFVMLPKVAISGRVVTTAGEGVPGAIVSHHNSGPDSRTANTDGSGQFVLPARPGRQHSLQAVAPGYGLAVAEGIKVDRESTSGIEIILRPEASVAGTVVDESGKPVPQAFVQAFTEHTYFGTPIREVRSEPDGSFLVPGLPGGIVYVRALKDKQVDAPRQMVELTPGETKHGLQLVLLTAKTLTGTVIDETGAPIPEAAVRITHGNGRSGWKAGISDFSGRFRIEEVIADIVMIYAEKEGFETPKPRTASVTQHGVTLIMQKQRIVTLVGSVIDARTSEPIVQFEAMLSNTWTDVVATKTGVPQLTIQGAGLFTLSPLLTNSQYEFILQAPGYKSLNLAQYPRRIPRATALDADQVTVKETFALDPAN